MRRRDYLLSSAAVVAFAGCIGDDQEAAGGENGSNGDEANGNGTPAGANGDNGTNDNENDTDEDEDETDTSDEQRGRPVGHIPTAAIHQWPFLGRDDGEIIDTIGGAHGTATADLETVSGAWRMGTAEYAPEGSEAHIDLGHLDAFTEATADGASTIMTTIHPTAIADDNSMTILGAGGGGMNWIEFRLNKSLGGFNGHPMLLIRDARANTISAVADQSVTVARDTRVAVRLDGHTADDIAFFIDGEPVGTLVLDNDGLEHHIDPDPTFGVFASNPSNAGTVGTRRFFSGIIDNVLICDEAISDDDIEQDYRSQPWS